MARNVPTPSETTVRAKGKLSYTPSAPVNIATYGGVIPSQHLYMNTPTRINYS